MFITFYGLSLFLPCLFMYWRGKKFALQRKSTNLGVVINSIGWSLLACWSLVIASIEGGTAIFALPSWFGIIFWLLHITNLKEGFLLFYPHILLTPTVPLTLYYVAYSINFRNIENAS